MNNNYGGSWQQPNQFGGNNGNGYMNQGMQQQNYQNGMGSPQNGFYNQNFGNQSQGMRQGNPMNSDSILKYTK